MNLQVLIFFNKFENLLGLLLDELDDDPDQLDECDDERPEGDRPQVIAKHTPHAFLIWAIFLRPKKLDRFINNKVILSHYYTF